MTALLQRCAGCSAPRLLGVPIDGRALAELVARAREAIQKREAPFVLACANPHSLVVARRDREFRRALETASAVIADGVGCQLGAVLSGVNIGPRITGSDFFRETMRTVDAGAGRVFFLGSREPTLSKIVERVRRDFPHVEAATLSPPFHAWSAQENEAIVAAVTAFAPDVLWVGMTAPKQEKWVAANVQRLDVPVIGSIGAVFDYYAGVTRRAPDWVCRIGLEWLYRLPREPRRLWRRTLVSAPLFLWWALMQRLEESARQAAPRAP